MIRHRAPLASGANVGTTSKKSFQTQGVEFSFFVSKGAADGESAFETCISDGLTVAICRQLTQSASERITALPAWTGPQLR